MAATDTTSTTAEFVDFFTELWSIGATDPERFFSLLEARMTPETRLIQPLAPTVRGPAGARELFMPLFESMPDMRSEVHRWGPTEDGVLIEHTLNGTLAGKHVRWTAIDRFILRDDGRFVERRVYFDPLPLVGAMLLRPQVSIKLLPGLLRRKERT
jgi:ketosteroid isomerase-like protein